MSYFIASNGSGSLLRRSLSTGYTYSLAASVASLNRGESVTFTISSTNSPAGTQVFFSLFGDLVAGVDYTAPTHSSFVIGSRQSITINTIANINTPRSSLLALKLSNLGVVAYAELINPSISGGTVVEVNNNSNITFAVDGQQSINVEVGPFTGLLEPTENIVLYYSYEINGVYGAETMLATTSNGTIDVGTLNLPGGVTRIKLSAGSLTDPSYPAGDEVMFSLVQEPSGNIDGSRWITSVAITSNI